MATKKRRRHRALFRRRSKAGAAPGTISVSKSAARPVVRVMAYGQEKLLERQIDDLGDLAKIVADHEVTWVNIDGLGDAKVIERLGDIFHLHRLALEDVVNVHQRAKVEPYGDVLFIVARMVSLGERISTEQLSIFLGEKFVLTFQERPGDCLDAVRLRIRDKIGRIRGVGADYLTYAIIDAVIDSYFPVVETYGERLDALEDAVVARARRGIMHTLHDLKRDLLVLRRNVWPLREAVDALVRETTGRFTEPTKIYLRDCHDHVVQLIDLVELARDLTSDIRDLHMSILGNRTNETMRVLTVIATIFIPLTFIAGLYGMNFEYMPELHWRLGYPVALGLMGLIAVGMLSFFVWRGWLGKRE